MRNGGYAEQMGSNRSVTTDQIILFVLLIAVFAGLIFRGRRILIDRAYRNGAGFIFRPFKPRSAFGPPQLATASTPVAVSGVQRR